jgi:hypothetical protein
MRGLRIEGAYARLDGITRYGVGGPVGLFWGHRRSSNHPRRCVIRQHSEQGVLHNVAIEGLAQGIVRSGKPYSLSDERSCTRRSAQRARKVLKALEAAAHAVCPIIIQQKIEVPDAIAIGQGVNEASPKSAATTEFADLFVWLGEQVKGR